MSLASQEGSCQSALGIALTFAQKLLCRALQVSELETTGLTQDICSMLVWPLFCLVRM